MTRKEAVEIIEKYNESFEGGASIYEALKMAADALKNDDAVIEKVIEIIDLETSDPSSGEGGDEPMSYAAGWMACGFLIKDKVLALKGGEQE